MSKILITVDTEKSTINVDIDGKKIADMGDVNIGKFKDFDGEPHISIHMVTETEQIGDMKSRTIVTASSKDAENAEGKLIGSSEDLVIFDNDSSISKAISDMLNKKYN